MAAKALSTAPSLSVIKDGVSVAGASGTGFSAGFVSAAGINTRATSYAVRCLSPEAGDPGFFDGTSTYKVMEGGEVDYQSYFGRYDIIVGTGTAAQLAQVQLRHIIAFEQLTADAANPPALTDILYAIDPTAVYQTDGSLSNYRIIHDKIYQFKPRQVGEASGVAYSSDRKTLAIRRGLSGTSARLYEQTAAGDIDQEDYGSYRLWEWFVADVDFSPGTAGSDYGITLYAQGIMKCSYKGIYPYPAS